jgi:hypothetical protein
MGRCQTENGDSTAAMYETGSEVGDLTDMKRYASGTLNTKVMRDVRRNVCSSGG